MTSSISPTEPVRPATQFTLLQILLATTAIAISIAVWRLPRGQWADIPLVIFSLALAWSLIRQAYVDWPPSSAWPKLSREQRAGHRLASAVRIGVAAVLAAGLGLHALAAQDLSFKKQEGLSLFFVVEYLSVDIVVLATIAALALGNRPRPVATNHSRNRAIISIAGAAGSWVAIGLFAAWSSLLPVLICIAVLGIELAEPAKFAPEGIDPNVVHRIDRFTLASFAGGATTLLNVTLIANLRRCEFRSGTRLWHGGAIVLSLAAQVYAAVWIVTRGIYQLAPPMTEALWWPTIDFAIGTTMLILLASLAMAWRSAVFRDIDGSPIDIRERKWFFHESWIAGTMASLLAVGIFAERLIHVPIYTFSSKLSEKVLTFLFGWPSQLIMVATIVCGIGQSWTRWRTRRATFNPAQLAVNAPKLITLTLILAIFIATAGPIFAAMGLSFWFSPLTKLF